MQGCELRAGVDAELVGEMFPELVVAVQRFVLPTRLVERPHVYGAEPLSEGMHSDEVAQLGCDERMLAHFQPGLGQLLEDRQPFLLQPVEGGLGERLVLEVGERGTAPQVQCPGEQSDPIVRTSGGSSVGHKRGEPVRVESVWCDPQLVSGRSVDDGRVCVRLGRPQRAAQLRDLRLQRVGRLGRGAGSPQVVDQPIRRHRAPDVHQQVGQERPNLELGHADGVAVVGVHGQWPENAESHMCTLVQETDKDGGRSLLPRPAGVVSPAGCRYRPGGP